MAKTDVRKLKVSIPEGKSGDWEVKKFIVSADDAKIFNLRSMFSGTGNRSIVPGTYTKLTQNNAVIMSDTPAEIRDHRYFVYEATGDVLINGLGLGWVALACALKKEVKTVTVIEHSVDVIKLVAKHLEKQCKGKLIIIHMDAFDYTPPKGKRYNAVWHDIWPNICGGNWESMKKLHRKYGRRCDYQSSWCRYEVKRDYDDGRVFADLLGTTSCSKLEEDFEI